ncbi:MAG: peptidoglycan-associated lipoprotein Pal [Burkholderiales bacterium]|nr:peptidoglycan-associated lipoprotein Pal [Burkholderiales bacterium]MBK8665246.1 peptidoglycan-associated lipoprotein Pal [Burkholderiales bacterium]
MMKRYLMVAALALVLAGCGSNVKLDPPIEGSPTTGVGAAGDGAGGALGQGAGQSTVTQVQAGGAGADAQGPVGVGRVIYFDYDSFTVKPDYQGVVDQHARFLQANRGRSVSLEGHTDERGSREYNLALGQKRAEAVRRALTLVGATDAQIEAVSFGEESPAVAGSTEDAYARNRRVELRYR